MIPGFSENWNNQDVSMSVMGEPYQPALNLFSTMLSHFEFIQCCLPALAASREALSIGSTSFGPSPFTSSDISSLTQPPPVPTMTGLTRSQSLFSTLTGINVHVLSIETSDEFFLFMDMRAELGWVSYNTTSRRWVLATASYNFRLEALNSAKNIVTIPKHPHALMEHLEPLR
jgi:hypothetical protein